MKESQSALSTFHFMADVLLEPLRWYVSLNNLVNDLRKSKWELQLCSYSVNGQVYIYNWMFLYSEVQELLVGFEAWSIQMVQLLATCRLWLLFVMRSVCVEKKICKTYMFINHHHHNFQTLLQSKLFEGSIYCQSDHLVFFSRRRSRRSTLNAK